MPVTAAARRNYLRAACRASKSSCKSLEAILESRLETSPALTGRPGIQSTSYGGHSASYFNPGQGGAMTASDESELIDWALGCLPGIEIAIEEQLGRQATPTEICAALIMAVPGGATEIANDYSLMRRGGCGISFL